MSLELLYLVSLSLAVAAFISGVYALWYDGRNQKRLRACATEYAALALSTTMSLVYIFLVGDWMQVRLDFPIGDKREAFWVFYHSVDKLVIILFHIVLVFRVLGVRKGDRRFDRKAG